MTAASPQFLLTYGGSTIDFTTFGGTSVVHRFNNPIIVQPTAKDTTVAGANQVGINIGFVNEAFDVTFTFNDGLGTLDFITPGTTNYEKLVYMAYKKNVKTLIINGLRITGHIENFSVPWRAGQKDLAINGSFAFRYVKDVKMDSGAGASHIATFANGSTTITMASASTYFAVNDAIAFGTTGTLPTNFTAGTTYYVKTVGSSSMTVAASPGGVAISAGSAGSGFHWGYSP